MSFLLKGREALTASGETDRGTCAGAFLEVQHLLELLIRKEGKWQGHLLSTDIFKASLAAFLSEVPANQPLERVAQVILEQNQALFEATEKFSKAHIVRDTMQLGMSQSLVDIKKPKHWEQQKRSEIASKNTERAATAAKGFGQVQIAPHYSGEQKDLESRQAHRAIIRRFEEALCADREGSLLDPYLARFFFNDFLEYTITAKQSEALQGKLATRWSSVEDTRCRLRALFDWLRDANEEDTLEGGAESWFLWSSELERKLAAVEKKGDLQASSQGHLAVKILLAQEAGRRDASLPETFEESTGSRGLRSAIQRLERRFGCERTVSLAPILLRFSLKSPLRVLWSKLLSHHSGHNSERPYWRDHPWRFKVDWETWTLKEIDVQSFFRELSLRVIAWQERLEAEALEAEIESRKPQEWSHRSEQTHSNSELLNALLISSKLCHKCKIPMEVQEHQTRSSDEMATFFAVCRRCGQGCFC